MTQRYRRLRAERILDYVTKLSMRVTERFPKHGLAAVCQELQEMADEAQGRIEKIAKPNLYLRAGIAGFIALIFFLSITGIARLNLNFQDADMVEMVEVVELIEAGIQDLIFIGAAIYFLASIENRIRRRRTVDSMNQLRALAHVVDMHQLTKDPELTLKVGGETKSSPKRELDAFLLGRYLDYCSEMLSIVGKLAALYVQDSDDVVALAAVNETEGLTTGLSRKIWQKIMIINQLGELGAAA